MDPTTLKTEAGRKAWLKARREGLGSSDAAAIANQSPWSSPLHVYLEKVGEYTPPDSEPKAWGRMLEDVVAQAYFDETGRLPRLPASAIMRHPQLPWMLASLDRVTEDSKGKLRVVELKTSRMADEWGTPGTDEVPDHYNLQVQHQLAVTGAEVADIAVLIGGQELRVYEVPRNERLIATLTTIESDFWGKVQGRQAPEPDWSHPRTGELIRDLYQVESDLTIDLGVEYLDLVWVIQTAGEQEKCAKATKGQAKLRLLEAMGHAGLARLPGGVMITRKKAHRKGYEVQPSEYVDFRIKLPKEKE